MAHPLSVQVLLELVEDEKETGLADAPPPPPLSPTNYALLRPSPRIRASSAPARTTFLEWEDYSFHESDEDSEEEEESVSRRRIEQVNIGETSERRGEIEEVPAPVQRRVMMTNAALSPTRNCHQPAGNSGTLDFTMQARSSTKKLDGKSKPQTDEKRKSAVERDRTPFTERGKQTTVNDSIREEVARTEQQRERAPLRNVLRDGLRSLPRVPYSESEDLDLEEVPMKKSRRSKPQVRSSCTEDHSADVLEKNVDGLKKRPRPSYLELFEEMVPEPRNSSKKKKNDGKSGKTTKTVFDPTMQWVFMKDEDDDLAEFNEFLAQQPGPSNRMPHQTEPRHNGTWVLMTWKEWEDFSEYRNRQ